MRFPFSLRSAARFDAVGLGTNAVDFLIEVPHYPDFDSKIELSRYTQAAGGEVASTMAGLSRLGMQTAYIGRFGDDQAGDFGFESLTKENVDLGFAQKIAGAITQIGFIIIDEKTGERTVIWKRDEKLSYLPEDVPTEAVEDCKILHMTPHDAAACVKLAKAAKQNGAVISLDIDNIFEGVEELLPLVDILIASKDLPSRLTGIGDHRSALKEMKAKYGNALVGITLGETGSLILCEDQFISSAGFAVPGGCRDTTGAGDAFRVGLLYGLLTARSIEESGKIANAVAALKCRAIGARTSLPNEAELLNFIN